MFAHHNNDANYGDEQVAYQERHELLSTGDCCML